MKQSLSFEKVKLTNNLHDKWGYVSTLMLHNTVHVNDVVELNSLLAK